MSNLGSLDKEVIRQAMKEVLAGVKPLLNVALLFASVTLVVLIIQSLLIAKLFSHLVLFTLHQETFPSAFLHNSLIALFFLFIGLNRLFKLIFVGGMVILFLVSFQCWAPFFKLKKK